jgi:hypothetical protein
MKLPTFPTTWKGFTWIDPPPTMNQLVNLLTNWQRNQWARAGYPQDVKIIRKFTKLARG